MGTVEKDGVLVWTYDSETLRIEAWGPHALRVRATRNAQIAHGRLLGAHPA